MKKEESDGLLKQIFVGVVVAVISAVAISWIHKSSNSTSNNSFEPRGQQKNEVRHVSPR